MESRFEPRFTENVALLADRSQREAALAIGATWVAFCVAVGLAVPQPPSPAQLGLGAVAGAFFVLTGFPAASRVRPLPVHEPAVRARLAAFSVLAGAALGAVLVGVLSLLARAEPALRARFVNRL